MNQPDEERQSEVLSKRGSVPVEFGVNTMAHGSFLAPQAGSSQTPSF